MASVGYLFIMTSSVTLMALIRYRSPNSSVLSNKSGKTESFPPQFDSFPLNRVSMIWLRFSLPLVLLSQCLVSGTLYAQGGPATVIVAPVVEHRLSAEQSYVANVKPWRQSTVGSAVDGRVLEYLVDAGQRVEQSQPLAQLRTKTIEIEIAAAEAELALRKAELAELQNGSRPDEVLLAESVKEVAQANNEYARAKLARAKRLFQEASGISQDEFEAARAESLVAAAKVAESESSFRLVKDGPRKEQIDQAAARVDMQQQIIEGLLDRKEKYTLKSPFAGYVSMEMTEIGAWVSQGDPVAQIVEIDPVEIEVYVPESSIQFVEPGKSVSISVEAASGNDFQGTIEQIVPLADGRARTFPVRIRVKNPMVGSRHQLLPGMLARVKLPSSELETRLMVPLDAIRLGGQSPTLYKIVDNKAVLVPVSIGPELGTGVAVAPLQQGQLAVGDHVAIRGNQRLRPGQDVLVTETQTNQLDASH